MVEDDLVEHQTHRASSEPDTRTTRRNDSYFVEKVNLRAPGAHLGGKGHCAMPPSFDFAFQ